MLIFDDQAEGLRNAGRIEGKAFAGTPEGRLPTRTIAVTSGKGGVGKTQVAANLAVSFAQRGHRVLVVDADMGLASLDLVLGVQPKADLLSVVRGEAALEDILVQGPAGVELASGCPGRYEMANLDARGRSLIWEALETLADRYDLIIVDTAAGIGASSVSFASWAHEILVVATGDPSSIRDAYAMTKVLHRRAGVTRLELIANAVNDEAHGLEVHESIDVVVRRFLPVGLGYLGCLPRDEAVRTAVVAREPFVLRSPGAPASRALSFLVRQLDIANVRLEVC